MPFLTLGAALLAPVACSVGFSTADGSAAGPGDNGDVSQYDAGTTDDRMSTGAGGDASFSSDGGAGAMFEGSPLCNYSKPHGCMPDTPPQPSDCNLGDGGAAPADGGVAPALACRVGYDTVLAAPAPVCASGGIGNDGDPCERSADCAAGFECVGSGQCRHYCCESATCANVKSTFCDIQGMKTPPVAGVNVPVCMPIRNCKLLTAGYCSDTETCAVVRPEDGATSCVAVGPGKVGDACDTQHCGRGLVCLGTVGTRLCFELCHTAAQECPTGKMCKSGAPLFPDPSVGICD